MVRIDLRSERCDALAPLIIFCLPLWIITGLLAIPCCLRSFSQLASLGIFWCF